MLIYNLCDGDITKVKEVEEMTLLDAIRFMSLKKYDLYIQEKQLKQTKR